MKDKISFYFIKNLKKNTINFFIIFTNKYY